ncbi:MAG: alpha-L-rhamnosidase C-terminal domain-containing protein [Lacunisphaera sp.]
MQLRVLLFLLSAVTAFASPLAEQGSGQPAPSARLLNDRWPASWIVLPNAPKNEYGVYLFRKHLDLAQLPEHFVVHVTGDARYRLFVNGHSVSFGPQRSDTTLWRYDTVDLRPWLKAGNNVLAAEVQSYGEDEPYAIMTLRTGFLLQGDTSAEEKVDTDGTWKVARDDSHRPLPLDQARLKTFIVVGPGDRLNGPQHPWGWTTTDFDDSSWVAARVLGHGQPEGWGTDVSWWLAPRSIPAMEETPQRLSRVRRSAGVQPSADFLAGKAPLTVPPHTKATVLLDQGFETSAFPQLTVSGGNASRVTLTYAEALFDPAGHKGNRDDIENREILGVTDEFRPDGGAHRHFAPFDFRTYRYLQLDIETDDEPLVVEDLYGMFTGYPFKENASFTSDDPELARIWTVGWRTARLCAFETYVDCPYYEQLQYVGDTRIQCLISLYVSGDDRLMRNAIELFDRSRIPEGLTQSRYPSISPQLINTFSLFWVDMVHDYWMFRQDDAFIRARLVGMNDVLGWFERRIDAKTGLLGPLPYWTFVDWTKEWGWSEERGIGGMPAGATEGGSAIVSLQLAGTLQRAAEIARAFGQTDHATHYEKLAAGLRAAVNQRCWDEKRHLFADTPEKKEFSQHVNVLAVLSGAVEGDAARELIGRVAHDSSLIQCSTYFRFYLLRAMKQAGLGDEYLAMLGPWRDMLSRGLTTFAEQPDPTRSDCHAWSASPVYDLLATVCGVESASRGFATVRIEPHLGKLKHAEGKVMHPKGAILVSLQREGDGLQAKVTLPSEVTGTFVWKGKSTPLKSGEQQLQLP